MEQLSLANLGKLNLGKRFQTIENVWILKLETLHPKGLNKESNKT